MPMKSTLPNKDELTIRFVMGEIDPSEQVLMQKALTEDENLLIEVEALRQTYARCTRKLPDMNPPAEVQQAILEKVAVQAEKAAQKAPVRYLTFRRLSYAAAATVVLSAGLGWNYINNDSATIPADGSVQTAIPADIEPVMNTPWIDNRDILHINTAGAGNLATELDSVTGRLRPVDDMTPASRPARQLQLTGSTQ
ncbi:MAG: hypothetical protein HLUCCA01_02660 [Bacteroidetes bacterium HLUCCA01]|nr:MAG: hypothetical protein HLUCCA01_02660 [Bacteroidetes bacterium HLUCCA01]